jgi:hypothetical protein
LYTGNVKNRAVLVSITPLYKSLQGDFKKIKVLEVPLKSNASKYPKFLTEINLTRGGNFGTGSRPKG